jgi:hypothetical protein
MLGPVGLVAPPPPSLGSTARSNEDVGVSLSLNTVLAFLSTIPCAFLLVPFLRL